jgi:RNA polymerase sigma-70 factor (ECF subfamily)
VDPVERARQGDADAFEVIVRDHHDRLKQVAWHIVRDDNTTFDVLQDAYLRAWRGIGGFRGDAKVGTWLHRIVVTSALNHVRKRTPVPVDPALGDEAHGEPTIDDRIAERERVSAALDALSPDHRAAVALVDLQGYPYGEAAEILGTNEKTLSSRLTRARHEIRRALGEEQQ